MLDAAAQRTEEQRFHVELWLRRRNVRLDFLQRQRQLLTSSKLCHTMLSSDLLPSLRLRRTASLLSCRTSGLITNQASRVRTRD